MMTPPVRPPRRPARTICLVSVMVIASWDVSVVMTMSPPLQAHPRSTDGFCTGCQDVRDVRCHYSWAGLGLGMLDGPPPRRCGLIERGRLQRGDGCPHQLLDRIAGIGTIGVATREAGNALRRDQRVIERPQKKVTTPDDCGTRNMRQALVDRIDKGMAGVIKSLRDNFPRDFVSFGRHHGAEPRETRAAASKIAT